MKKYCFLLLCLLPLTSSAALYVTIVQGLGGTQGYGSRFTIQTDKLQEAAASLTPDENISVFRNDAATRDRLLAHFKEQGNNLNVSDRVAIFLVGHGSYDGYQYKFNIPGPDLTDDDLAGLLNELPNKNQLLVNTGSTSGATLERLKNESRIIITATRSGNERNATRFGTFFTDALEDPSADTKNNSISVQEAFDYSLRQVEEYFENQGQLATEHPQIEGEGAPQFNLARLTPKRSLPPNSALAALIKQRDALNGEIEELQLDREKLEETEYFSRLQELVIKLAHLEDQIDQQEESIQDAN